MKRNNICYFLILGLVIAALGCSTSNSVSQQKYPNTNPENNWTLREHLQRKVGVRILGSGPNARVVIRGEKSTMNPNNQPLFVIDGQKTGRGFSSANSMLYPGEIKSVQVLPPSKAVRYGMEGHYGVILIHTKNEK